MVVVTTSGVGEGCAATAGTVPAMVGDDTATARATLAGDDEESASAGVDPASGVEDSAAAEMLPAGDDDITVSSGAVSADDGEE